MLAPQLIKSEFTNARNGLMEKCLRCSRPLTNPVSMYVGFGPICSEILGIPRPEYNELLKLNPENDEQLLKLREARQKLEAANKIEGSVTLENDQVIIKFPWGCQDFDALKATVKKFASKWNPQKKQWEAPKLQLPMLLEGLKVFPNLAIDESLFANTDSVPPTSPDATTAMSCPLDHKTASVVSKTFSQPSVSKLESLAAQMKKRLETVDVTNATLKNGLQLFLKKVSCPFDNHSESYVKRTKKENNTYKVFCVRESVLPSKVEIRVIGNSFFGKGQWEFGKAKTSPPLPTEGYVIQSKSTD